MRKIYIILAIIAFSLPALADYHYASHMGSNAFPYTSWETATDSIKYAISAADPGDTVYIGAGEYFEMVVMAAADSNLALIGAGIDSTHWWYDITGTSTLRCANNTFIENIYFSHSRTTGISTYFDNDVKINHCKFTHRSIVIMANCSVIVENCEFDSVLEAVSGWGHNRKIIIRNNLVNFITQESAFGGVYADTLYIENNIIIDPQWQSILTDISDNEQMIRNNLIFQHFPDYRAGDCWNCRVVVNNTFDNINNIYTPTPAISVNYFGRQIIKNNSFSRIPYAAIDAQYGSRHVSVSYSNLWQVGRLAVSQNLDLDTVGIQWRDPMFVDTNDYHLQAFSPLIDMGDPAILDVDGTRSDIGVYGGPYGSSYENRDLPPDVPDSIWGQLIADTALIVWRMNTEADFAYYRVYRDTISGFVPFEGNLIAEPESSYYADSNLPLSRACYYRISALDNQGNVSNYSDELNLSLVGISDNFGAEMPGVTAIESNYPNPFNSQTMIVYKVANLGPIPAQINIDIYDILGRHVRELVNGKGGIGIFHAVWDGRDDQGKELSSGIYFARITQWGIAMGNKPKKLVLMK